MPVLSGQQHQSVEIKTELREFVMYHKHPEVLPKRSTMIVVVEIPSCSPLDVYESIFVFSCAGLLPSHWFLSPP